MPEHGAVIDTFAALVRPGVAVRIEVDQRQRAVFAGMGLEQRIGDEVVAAKRQHRAAGIKNALGMRLDAFRDGVR